MSKRNKKMILIIAIISFIIGMIFLIFEIRHNYFKIETTGTVVDFVPVRSIFA